MVFPKEIADKIGEASTPGPADAAASTGSAQVVPKIETAADLHSLVYGASEAGIVVGSVIVKKGEMAFWRTDRECRIMVLGVRCIYIYIYTSTHVHVCVPAEVQDQADNYRRQGDDSESGRWQGSRHHANHNP